MFNLKNRIYLSTFVNSFGSWLTFLAIALITQEKYGPQHVALVFLVQTLPAIILSRGLASLVPASAIKKVYWITQVLLGFSSLLLMINQSLWAIYIFLFVTSVLKSLGNPLFNSLIGDLIKSEDQKVVFTRVGALQAGTLALAPAFGAWIKITSSASFLFLIDGVSFLIGVVVLFELFRNTATNNTVEKFSFDWKKIFAGISARPGNIPLPIQKGLAVWFLFLAVGALINAIEFPAFQRAAMTEQLIGYAMAAWGIGNLVAFLIKNPLQDKVLFAFFAFALIGFAFVGNSYVLILSFLVAGALSSYLSGTIRAHVQGSVPEGYHAAPVWAYANQVTQIINLIAYSSVGFLLGVVGFYTFGIGLVVLAALMSYQFLDLTLYVEKVRG